MLSRSNLKPIVDTLSFDSAIQLLQQKVTRRGIHYSLDRLNSVLLLLNNPHLNLPKTIHIAGTNGKGSVAHGLTHILVQKGFRVVTYTSPHIQCYTERFQFNGSPISQMEFSEWLTKISHCDPDDNLSEYELLTIMAFCMAKELRPDVLILETGLGGRLDATNVVPSSMAIITDIGLDHTQILGGNLRDIASEKAGIIKPNEPVVTHLDHDSTVLEVIKSNSKSMNAILHWAPPKKTFQERNLSLIQTALSAFFDIDLSDTDLHDIPSPFGRLTKTTYQGIPCMVDVGHNAHAVTAILQSGIGISEWVIGMKQEKDIDAVIETLIQHKQMIRICEYTPKICHCFNNLTEDHQKHVSIWLIGNSIQPNSLFFGSFTFIETLLDRAIKK